MKNVLMVFVDGLGIGRRDPAINPCAGFRGKILNVFSDGDALLPFG